MLAGDRVAFGQVLKSEIDQLGGGVPSVKNISRYDDGAEEGFGQRVQFVQLPGHRGVPIRLSTAGYRWLVAQV